MKIHCGISRFLLVVCTSATLAAGYAAVSQADTSTSNKWRIEFDGGANSDGEIVFRVTPEGGEPIDVNARINDGTGENRVASKVRDAFREQLPDGAYHVEKDDGEDVLVKRRGDTPDFSVELVSSSVKSVDIDIEHE